MKNSVFLSSVLLMTSTFTVSAAQNTDVSADVSFDFNRVTRPVAESELCDLAPEQLMRINGKKSPLRADGRGITARINIDDEIGAYTPRLFYIYNEEYFIGGSYDSFKDAQTGAILVDNMTPGVYTVFVSFEEKKSHGGSAWTKCYIFKEDVAINPASNVTSVNPSDAVNQFAGKSFLPGGEEARLDAYIYDAYGNYEFEPGNVLNKYITTTIYDSHFDAYVVSSILGTGTYDLINYMGPGIDWQLETKENFYVNDISDRYVICQQRQNYTTQGLVATAAFSRGLSNRRLENDWNNYSEYTEFFSHTPAYDIYGSDDVYSQITGFGEDYTYNFTYEMIPWGMPDVPPTLLYSASENADDFLTTHPYYRFSLQDAIVTGYDYQLKGQRLVLTGQEGAYEFTNFSLPSYVSGVMALNPEGEEVYYEYPGHPKLRVDLGKGEYINYRYGNSAPLNIVRPQIYKADYGFVTAFTPSYSGLYGESREADIVSVDVAAYLNGEKKADMTGWNSFWSSVPAKPTSDVYAAEFTDTNVSVDGVEGYNKTMLSFRYEGNDICPPAIQNIQTRNSAGELTQYFERAEDLTISVCAGDYDWTDTPDELQYNYESKPVTLTVEIAPHGQADEENWEKVEIKNIVEYNNLAAFGVYYESELAKIPKNLVGWYDVRVTATDNAGNFNRQQFGPVFEVKGTGGIDSPRVDFEIIGNRLYVSDDSARWTVYGIDGTLLLTYTGKSINIEQLSSGVYVVDVFTNNKHKTKKIII